MGNLIGENGKMITFKTKQVDKKFNKRLPQDISTLITGSQDELQVTLGLIQSKHFLWVLECSANQ